MAVQIDKLKGVLSHKHKISDIKELNTSLNNKITGDGIAKITVSDTAPVNPQFGDLWVDIS